MKIMRRIASIAMIVLLAFGGVSCKSNQIPAQGEWGEDFDGFSCALKVNSSKMSVFDTNDVSLLMRNNTAQTKTFDANQYAVLDYYYGTTLADEKSGDFYLAVEDPNSATGKNYQDVLEFAPGEIKEFFLESYSPTKGRGSYYIAGYMSYWDIPIVTFTAK